MTNKSKLCISIAHFLFTRALASVLHKSSFDSGRNVVAFCLPSHFRWQRTTNRLQPALNNFAFPIKSFSLRIFSMGVSQKTLCSMNHPDNCEDRQVRIFLFRHGQTNWNAETRIQGSSGLLIMQYNCIYTVSSLLSEICRLFSIDCKRNRTSKNCWRVPQKLLLFNKSTIRQSLCLATV